jgi:hypothetical protein
MASDRTLARWRLLYRGTASKEGRRVCAASPTGLLLVDRVVECFLSR